MLKTGYSAPMSHRAAAALLRARRVEIVAGVVRQAAAGDRAAMRLASKHGLPVEPAPDVVAARMAESIERTRATVATLLAEGGLEVGKDSRPRPGQPGRCAGDRPFRRENPASRGCVALRCIDGGVELVNNNENTSAGGERQRDDFGVEK
jgi:hypothetical protein